MILGRGFAPTSTIPSWNGCLSSHFRLVLEGEGGTLAICVSQSNVRLFLLGSRDPSSFIVLSATLIYVFFFSTISPC